MYVPPVMTLLAGGVIQEPIREDLTYDIAHSAEDNLWNILYLTCNSFIFQIIVLTPFNRFFLICVCLVIIPLLFNPKLTDAVFKTPECATAADCPAQFFPCGIRERINEVLHDIIFADVKRCGESIESIGC